MFKVECPGCNAPYQVDERRVPQSGLKMRCPKCGTSFQVDPPPPDPRGANPNPVLSGPAGPSESDDPARPALPRRKPPVKGTMIGVAPPLARPGAAPPQSPPAAPPPAEPDPFGSLDLPEVASPKARPAPAARPTQADKPAPIDELDLPVPAAVSPPRGHPTRPQGSPPLPRPGAPTAAPPTAQKPPVDPFELDLPVAASAHRAPEPFDDLPATPRERDSDQLAGLPVAAARRQVVDLPSVKPAAPVHRAPALAVDSDFPALLEGSLEADLPSPSRGVDLPSPSPGVGLPARSPP